MALLTAGQDRTASPSILQARHGRNGRKSFLETAEGPCSLGYALSATSETDDDDDDDDDDNDDDDNDDGRR